MSINIDLPHDLEDELSAEAAKLGLSLPQYALRLLTTRAVLSNSPRTGAQLVEYWQSEGVVGTRPEMSDSQDHARGLRDRAETRERA